MSDFETSITEPQIATLANEGSVVVLPWSSDQDETRKIFEHELKMCKKD